MRLFVVEGNTPQDKAIESLKQDVNAIKKRILLYTRLKEPDQVSALKRRMATLNTALRKMMLANTCEAYQWQLRHVIKTERNGWTTDVLNKVPEVPRQQVYDSEVYTFADNSTLTVSPAQTGGYSIMACK